MKILILQNRMGIGDMIMFLPFIEAISKKFKTPVTILAKKNTKVEMYFNNKEIVEEIMYLEREDNKKHSGVKGFFKLVNELKLKMKNEVDNSSENLKLKLLRSHPELGIKKNEISSLTQSSQAEQKSAGLDQCSEEEYEEIKSLNRLYKEKFDFPFIIAVKGLNRSDIIKSMKNRVKNNYQEEFSTAINEVHKIAKIRLDALEL